MSGGAIHLNTSRTADGRSGAPRPADECPWPRPFPAGFDKCPAFLQQHFIPIDSSYKPLPPVLTCRHLVSVPLQHRKGGWYGGCEIGDAAAREKWVAEVDAGWLQGVGELRRKMEVINRPFIEQIWAAKATQLVAERQGHSVQPATQALQAMANAFLEESTAFLSLHQQEFVDLELPPEAIMLLLRRSLAKFVAQDGAEARWEVPSDVLEEFPERVRVFFRPRRST
jgi:hypothetical protein